MTRAASAGWKSLRWGEGLEDARSTMGGMTALRVSHLPMSHFDSGPSKHTTMQCNVGLETRVVPQNPIMPPVTR